MFSGAIVAIVTPFRNGKVDEEALRKLIEEQIAAGTDGIAPCGTTGESTTLSHEEHDRVPLCRMAPKNEESLKTVMQTYGLIK